MLFTKLAEEIHGDSKNRKNHDFSAMIILLVAFLSPAGVKAAVRPRSAEREEAHQPPAESGVYFRSGSYVGIYSKSNTLLYI
ncbi:hypothetical protein JOD43_001135 [Pullulanibacillus pueri]|nr:hypothetical protein [Pullulanibacillus pueri]